MMNIQVSKDIGISRWIDLENFACVRWNRIKNCAQTERLMDGGKICLGIFDLDLSKASGPDCITVAAIKNCELELSYI